MNKPERQRVWRVLHAGSLEQWMRIFLVANVVAFLQERVEQQGRVDDCVHEIREQQHAIRDTLSRGRPHCISEPVGEIERKVRGGRATIPKTEIDSIVPQRDTDKVQDVRRGHECNPPAE